MTGQKVNVVGAGNVGQTLMGLLQRVKGYEIQDVLSGQIASAQQAVSRWGTGRAVADVSQMRGADIWIITVPDGQIAGVGEDIARALHGQAQRDGQTGQHGRVVAFHCSGFLAAAALAPLRDLGWHIASAHPVLTFSDPQAAMAHFDGVLCGMEGDRQAVQAVEHLFRQLGATPFPIDPKNKSLYHAAAVISNNFTVVLQAIAREAWQAAGVPDDIACKLNASLLEATCRNVIAQGPRAALTGPAARGDTAVVSRQGKDVQNWHPAAGAVYAELSAMARNLKLQGSTRGGQETE